MEPKWFWILLIVLFVEGWSETEGCLEHERVALLQLKSFFNNPYYLRDWVDAKSSNCCHWERVECSIPSRQVIGLSLDYTRKREPRGQYGYLNASLFLPFKELKSLHLSENNIAGFVDNEGFAKLSSTLKKLEVLDLSGNCFNGSILSSLSELSSLKALYLRSNEFTRSNYTEGFAKLSSALKKLKLLDLSDNHFNESILSSLSAFSSLKSLYLGSNEFTGSNHSNGFKWLSRFSNLETLDLMANDLKNTFLLHVSGLSSLKTLNLAYNQLKGSINIQELNRVTNLRNLDLSNNAIESFRSFQGGQRQLIVNLEELDLSFNLLQNNTFAYISRLSNLKSLSIGSNKLQGSIDIKELNNLTKLKKLDMHSNEIESIRSFEDGKRQLKLINLEELDLSRNHLNNSVLTVLSELSSLKHLNLGWNNLKGSTNIKELEALHNLEELNFNGNELHDVVAFKEIRSLKKLRVAHLDGVFPNGTVSLLQVIEAFPSVKILFLGNNYLNKTISTQELNLSSNVEEIFMHGSHLSDNILQSIGVLTSLKTLGLSYCGLTGILPTRGWCDLRNLEGLNLEGNALKGSFPSCFDNLTSLRFLDISENRFEVSSSFKSFANHSHLKVLFIDQNYLVRESTLQTWTKNPRFQLKLLSMSNCTTKVLPKELPNFVYYQHDLRYIDLSYNNFGGKIPSWLLENNTRLQQFILAANSFKGPLQLPKHANVDMFEVDMSQNKMQGEIPMNICSMFPHLEALSLSHNALEGNIPPCFSDLKSLYLLDLSYNNFSGGILEDLAKSNSLEILRLSNNNLSGKITPTIFSSSYLEQLYIGGNNFDGEIPLVDISAGSNSYIYDIDLSNNHLFGKLPRWICNVSTLETLDFSSNNFDGLIPLELCNLDRLRYLDLSQNNFLGSMPSCFNSPNIEHVLLSRNRLSGPLSHAFYNLSSLVTLDLSQNNLTGKIPHWIDTLSTLSILILKANHFVGKIPSQICRLNSLSIIDLSQNELFGHVPSCLSNLTLDPNDEKAFSAGGLGFGIGMLEYLDLEDLGHSKHYDPVYYAEANSRHYHLYHSVETRVAFMTKKGLYTYSGKILEYMSGIDLSCNRLTGQIPLEIGNLSELHSLNLSHKNFTGFIPSTFSKLKQIESLDLSHNNLSGRIPVQLMELNSLAVFNVSYNNLSGSIPYEKAQFATFDESSYLGNPFLCGPPLHQNCAATDSIPTAPNASSSDEESGLLDKYVFHVTFWVSYSIVLMVIAAVLYINPYWRQAWFYFIEQCTNACHFFVVDNILELSIFRRSW